MGPWMFLAQRLRLSVRPNLNRERTRPRTGCRFFGRSLGLDALSGGQLIVVPFFHAQARPRF